MRFLLLTLLLSLTTTVTAQNKFGQVTLDAAPTWNAWRGIHRFPFRNYETNFDFTVGLNASADWAMFRRMSLGVGFSTHNHTLNISDYSWSDANGTYTEDVIQRISSNSLNARVLFHPLKIYEKYSGKLDFYFGGQQSFFWINTSNNSNDPNFYKSDETMEKIPMLVAGIRYYPLENLGLHLEACLPGVYTFACGLSYRIGGRDKFFGR